MILLLRAQFHQYNSDFIIHSYALKIELEPNV
jgi:hypothetical protein